MAGVAFAVEGDGVGFATESYAASALYTTLASLSGALWRIRRARSIEMAIYRLIKNCTLEPERVSRITEAYEQALHTLCVKGRDDPLTEMIAKTIIKIAQAGVHDAAQLSVLAIAELRIR